MQRIPIATLDGAYYGQFAGNRPQGLQRETRGELPATDVPTPEELLYETRMHERIAVVNPHHCQTEQRVAEVAHRRYELDQRVGLKPHVSRPAHRLIDR